MKETRANSFSKANITYDEETGRFTIEEIGKDSSVINDLTEVLLEWTNVEGVSLIIKKDTIQE